MRKKELLVIVGVFAIGIGGYKLFDSYVDSQYNENENNGEWVLKTYFDKPNEPVRNVMGKAIGWMGYDNSVRFECDGVVTLKEQKNYVTAKNEDVIPLLLRQFPNDSAVLSDTANITCLFKVKPGSPGAGEHFAVNHKTKTYFLWSHYSH